MKPPHLVVWLAMLLVAATGIISDPSTTTIYDSIPNPALWTDYSTIWALSGPCPGGTCRDSGKNLCLLAIVIFYWEN